MKQITPSFNLLAPEHDFANAQLFVEAGPAGLSMAVLDKKNFYSAIRHYSFTAGMEAGLMAENLSNICETDFLLQQQYHKTAILWSFPATILVPAECMDTANPADLCSLIFGESIQGIVKSDFLFRKNQHLVYQIPYDVNELFAKHFSSASQTHFFSCLANRNLPDGEHIFTVFYSNSITIMLSVEGTVQVLQNFYYHQTDDCLFHLLNVCSSFNINTATVVLHINGMIDEKSALFTAVYNYFLNIEFDKLPENFTYFDSIKQYPEHFFSHLFELTTCV